MTLEEFNLMLPKKLQNCVVLNQSQVAEVLGVSNSTLENWRKGAISLPYIKIDTGKRGRVMYEKTKIVEFLNRNSIVVA